MLYIYIRNIKHYEKVAVGRGDSSIEGPNPKDGRRPQGNAQENRVALSDQLSTIERNLYGNWKAMNAKFVKMYIKEMLDKGILTIDAKTSEGGYFNIDVMFDGQCIASTDGQICMDRFFS